MRTVLIRSRVPLCIAVASAPLVAPAVRAQELERFRSRHYAVQTDAAEDEARSIAGYMDLVNEEYTDRFAAFIDARRSSFELYLLRTEQEYLTLLSSFGVAPDGTAGIFFAKGEHRGLATWIEGRSRSRTLRVLQHEGFHQLAHSRIGRMPPWIDEGMAEYFGEGMFVGGRFRTGILDPLRIERIQSAIRGERLLDLEQLVGVSGEQWLGRVAVGGESAAVVYDQAWSVVDFLINAEGGRYESVLMEYLRNLSYGGDFDQAFENAFGDDLEPFESAWLDYAKRRTADPLGVARHRLTFLAEGLRALHAEGLTPKTIDELRDHLQAGGFRITQAVGPTQIVVDAADDALYRPPDANGGGPAPTLELQRNRDDTLPPEILVRRAGPVREVRVYWYRRNGSLGFDFE